MRMQMQMRMKMYNIMYVNEAAVPLYWLFHPGTPPLYTKHASPAMDTMRLAALGI